MKRNNPTRIVETGRVMRGQSGQGIGWLQPLKERLTGLRAKIAGIHDRLSSPLRNGVPGCVLGEVTFVADTTQVISIPNYPMDPDAIPPAPFVALTVNPIFRAGQTYRIPILFPPPGVFEAHNLVVSIEAGYLAFADQNRPGITPLSDYRQIRDGGFLGGVDGFTKRDPSAGVIQYTWQQQVLNDFEASRSLPFMPFFWNIIDEKSGRQYAQSWLPHGALLNTRSVSTGSDQNDYPDSEFFEFDTPWIFERDGQVSFLFRPLMDLFQVDAACPVLPYGTADDRSGGRRVEQATVRVEFHGNRYYTAQDLLKDGAFVTNDPGNQPNIRNP